MNAVTEPDSFLRDTGTNALAGFVYSITAARDWAKQLLRDRLMSANTDVLKTDGFEVRLVAQKVLACVCHGLVPEECHHDGETVALKLVELPAYLTVRKRKDGHYGATE